MCRSLSPLHGNASMIHSLRGNCLAYYKEEKSKREREQQKQVYMTTALCGFCSGNNTTETAVAANKHPIVTAALSPLFYCVSEGADVWQCSWLARCQASPAMGWQAWLEACPAPPYREASFLSTPWFSRWLVQPSSVISCVTGRREGVCSEQKSMRPHSSAGMADLASSRPAQPGSVFGLWQHRAVSSSSHRACPAPQGTSLVGAGVGLPALPAIALFRGASHAASLKARAGLQGSSVAAAQSCCVFQRYLQAPSP